MDLYFISHAWGVAFSTLVKALHDHFVAAGATLDSVYLWIDIFTINQWNPTADLNDGKTLQRTIEISHSTLVVLDSRAVAFSRLWCLFEMGSTRQDLLTLITCKAEEANYASVFASIDVESAECYDETAKAMIQGEIIAKHGSLQRFTAFLRLRFLLRPQLSFEADVEELVRRAADDEWRFGEVRDLLQLQTAAEAREAAEHAAREREAAAAAGSRRPSGLSVSGAAGAGPGSPAKSPSGGGSGMKRDREASDTGGGARGAIPEEEDESAASGRHSAGAEGAHGNMLLRAKSDFNDLLNGTLDGGEWGLGGGGGTPSVLACVVAGSGEGKSTFSARLSKEEWVDAYHFCKHSDARRQDPVLIAKTLAYQLAVSKNPDISGPMQRALLALDPEAVAGLQKIDEAVSELLLGPLRNLPDGQTVVLLFDALDEAEQAPGAGGALASVASAAAGGAAQEQGSNALANPLLRFLSLLHGGDSGSHLRVVVTTRPKPAHLVEALQGRWGAAYFKLLPLRDLCAASAAAPSPAMRARQRSLLRTLALNPDLEASKVFCFVAGELVARGAASRTPTSLQDAYLAWFTGYFPASEFEREPVVNLLRLLMAAREPPSLNLLEKIPGVSGAFEQLPGWRVLFQERDFHLQASHKSLEEWLTREAPPPFRVDVAAGHKMWADFWFPRVVDLRGSAPIDELGLQYLLSHLLGCSDWDRLSRALLDLDLWEHAYARGLDFALIEEVAAASRAADKAGPEAAGARRVTNDVLRWLLWQGPTMRRDPRSVLQRATVAPAGSAIGATIKSFYRQPGVVLVRPPGGGWPAYLLSIPHPRAVLSVAFSPDGARLLAAVGRDTLVLDAATGQLLVRLSGHRRRVNCCAWSEREGSGVIATGSADGVVKIWAAATGVETRTLAGHAEETLCVALSADGARAVSGSLDKTAVVWCCASGAAVHTLAGHGGAVVAAAFSRDGALVATGSRDYTAMLFDAATGRRLFVLTGHTAEVTAVAFHPRGESLVTASMDTSLRVWSCATGKPLRQPMLGHQGPVTAAAFDQQGVHVVSCSGDKTLKIWHAATGLRLDTLSGHSGVPWCVSFSGDGARVVSGDLSGQLHLWEVQAGSVSERQSLNVGDGSAFAFAPGSDAALFVASRAAGGRAVARWSLSGGRQAGLPLEGHLGAVRALAFSRDGGRMLSGGEDFRCLVFELQGRDGGGRQLLSLSGHSGAVRAAAFSPDGLWAASASMDRTVRVWGLSTGVEIRVLAHAAPVTAVCFSTTGARLLSGCGDGALTLFETGTGVEVRRVATAHSGCVHAVSFAPSGFRFVSVAEDAAAHVWEASTCRLLLTVPHPVPVLCLAFPAAPGRGASGDLLLTGCEDGLVRLWDVGVKAAEPSDAPPPCLRQYAQPPPAGAPVRACCFADDGQRVCAALDGGFVRRWDFSTAQAVSWVVFASGGGGGGAPAGGLLREGSSGGAGSAAGAQQQQQQQQQLGARSAVRCLAMSADGSRAIAGHENGRAVMLDCATGQELRVVAHHRGEVRAVAFTHGGHRAASIGGQALCVADGTTGEQRLVVDLPAAAGGALTCLAFSGPHFASDDPLGGALAAVGTPGGVAVVDVRAGGKLLRMLAAKGSPRAGVTCCVWSADCARVIAGDEAGTVTVFDAHTGAAVRPLLGHTGAITAVALSSVGNKLVSSSADGSLRLWDVPSGFSVRTMTQVGFTGSAGAEMRGVFFSPDGSRVVSIASSALGGSSGGGGVAGAGAAPGKPASGVVCVWDLASGTLIGEITAHEAEVTAAVLVEDGRLCTSGADGTVRLWGLWRQGAPDARLATRLMHTFHAEAPVLALAAVPTQAREGGGSGGGGGVGPDGAPTPLKRGTLRGLQQMRSTLARTQSSALAAGPRGGAAGASLARNGSLRGGVGRSVLGLPVAIFCSGTAGGDCRIGKFVD